MFGPGQPPQLCVNLELHRFSNSRVTLLQQRGAVLSGEEQAFAAQLVEWSRRSGFKVICICKRKMRLSNFAQPAKKKGTPFEIASTSVYGRPRCSLSNTRKPGPPSRCNSAHQSAQLYDSCKCPPAHAPFAKAMLSLWEPLLNHTGYGIV